METLDKGMADVLAWTEQYSLRFHHTAENSAPCKTWKLVILEFSIYYFRPQLTAGNRGWWWWWGATVVNNWVNAMTEVHSRAINTKCTDTLASMGLP